MGWRSQLRSAAAKKALSSRNLPPGFPEAARKALLSGQTLPAGFSFASAAAGKGGLMKDGEEKEEIVEEKQRILQLEKEVELLATKCSRLEAQNILVSAQQLDIMARLFAILLSGLSLRFYWTSLCWISSYLSWHSYAVVALNLSHHHGADQVSPVACTHLCQQW
eukprot:scaffold5633_cov46-Attheya_sp.AAC.3